MDLYLKKKSYIFLFIILYYIIQIQKSIIQIKWIKCGFIRGQLGNREPRYILEQIRKHWQFQDCYFL